MIRHETKADYDEISMVTELAFGQRNESEMIINLRKNSAFIPELSLVYIENEKVVGHILFFPLDIVSGEERYQSISLAPMAVLPEYQNKNIGSNLVKYGLEKLREMNFKSCSVLGHPEYYPRFGFEKASKWGIKPPINGIPDDAFMAIELVPGSLEGKEGVVEWPKEYYDAI